MDETWIYHYSTGTKQCMEVGGCVQRKTKSIAETHASVFRKQQGLLFKKGKNNYAHLFNQLNEKILGTKARFQKK